MKTHHSLSRRDAIKTFTLLGSGLIVAPGIYARSKGMTRRIMPGDRPGILAIGVRSRGRHIALHACNYGRMVACCDVDTAMFGRFQEELLEFQDTDPFYYTDYRAALERKDVDVVTIGTPEHWHALMIKDALDAGKDVYVEKPLTLTVGEGIAVCEAARNSNRVIQVGTQQRSEYDGIFLKAVAIAREGILGKKLKATAYVPRKRTEKDVYPIIDPPPSLNWDKWCGPVQKLPYSTPRGHGNWRGFVETGHGTLTDWGAHHVDIAQWALGVDHTGPVEISGEGIFPHGNDATLAVITGDKPPSSLPNSYSIAREFRGEMRFENGNAISLTDYSPALEYAGHETGLELEGENGSIFMSRSTRGFDFEGSLGEEIKNDRTLQQKINERVIRLHKGKIPAYLHEEMKGERVIRPHMKNFFDCVKDREEPISDVFTAHRANTSCLLVNASILLDRTLNWDPGQQDFVGDNQASRLLLRPYREPYEL